MKWPIPASPTAERTATAPFNFVPLPEAVYLPPGLPSRPLDQPFAAFDRLDPALLHGRIDLTITAKTELYTRCAYPPSEEGKDVSKEAGQALADFFHHGEPDTPVIPGSSLRGMVRSLVEILSYARMDRFDPPFDRRSAGKQAVRVLDRRLVYRAVADQQTPSGTAYANAFLTRAGTVTRSPGDHVRAGYLESLGKGRFAIRPALRDPTTGRGYARVKDERLRVGGLPVPDQQNRRDPNHQTTRDVWIGPMKKVTTKGVNGVSLEYPLVDDVRATHVANLGSAKLVYSGPMMKRRAHTVVLPADPMERVIPIPEDLWEHYVEDRELTRGIATRKLGKHGDVLFYRLDPTTGALDFFGPTLFFRILHDERTTAFLPQGVSGPQDGRLDLAERIFGTVNGEPDPDRDAGVRTHLGPHRGRVSFADAPWNRQGGPPFLEGVRYRYPDILSSPKPTSYQTYLVQPNAAKTALRGYSRNAVGKTVLRGTKRYWHRGSAADSLKPALDHAAQEKKTQYTRIKPVRLGAVFSGAVHFENLDPIELGALLAALELPEGCFHHLGMGKPLGMGSVRIETNVSLYDGKRRYLSLSSTGRRSDSERDARLKQAREAFRAQLVAHHQRAVSAPAVSDDASLWDLPRLRELKELLTWHADKTNWRRQTSYMVLDQFKLRLVLPTPSRVSGEAGRGVAGYNVTAGTPDSPGSVGDPQALETSASSPAGGGQHGGARAPASAPVSGASQMASQMARVAAPTAPRIEALGKIVRYTADGVFIRLDGEAQTRVVPLDGRVIVGFVGAFNGSTLKPDRRVKVLCEGAKVVRMEPG